MSKNKINNWDQLEKARLEARLEAEQSLGQIRASGSEIKKNVSGISTFFKVVKSAAFFSRKTGTTSNVQSGIHSRAVETNIALRILEQLGREKPNWRPILFAIALWLIESGYLSELARMKKSDVYAFLLKVVRALRQRLRE